jgi:hypothetical protein
MFRKIKWPPIGVIVEATPFCISRSLLDHPHVHHKVLSACEVALSRTSSLDSCFIVTSDYQSLLSPILSSPRLTAHLYQCPHAPAIHPYALNLCA